MPVEIFFCYAREDEALRQELEKQLRVLRSEGLIEIWHDRKISAGSEWQREINRYLNSADIILLLVSPDFIASDYCYGIEMKRAMERYERGEACVIPIILRNTSSWERAPFGKLQALPTDAKPVTDSSWHDLDSAFCNVADGIRKKVEQLLLIRRFAKACNTDNDSEIITVYQEMQASPYHQSFTFSVQEQQRIALAQRREATRKFRVILEGGNLEQIVAAYNQVQDKIALTEQEQESVILACQFMRAFHEDDNDAFIAAYDNIVASAYRGLFTFTEQQLHRVALTRQAQGLIEHLWYTYSHVGFAEVTGYQVRAASQGLQDFKNERVHDLGTYLHYNLPLGVNVHDLPLEMAPISLAFILTKQGERILVNRKYTGKDQAGRPGCFFCHLLKGFPKEFSGKDAIRLWKSSIWQDSEVTLPLNERTLPYLSLQDLYRIQEPFKIQYLQENKKVQSYLYWLIQAYLIRREDQQIFIVAYADDVANSIYYLTLSLPQNLLKNLTFNTYEYDASTAKEQIVGTYWYIPSNTPEDAYPRLPSFCYQNGIVINGYSGRMSGSKTDPRACSYAQFAAKSLLEGGGSLTHFLSIVSDINTEDFLSFFEDFGHKE